MSERKGPRPVAWEGWHATITGEPPRGVRSGVVDVQEYELDESGVEFPSHDYTMTPDEAETHAHALIMAAAVARGEQGHTAALNRVAVALNAPFDRLTNPSPDHLRALCHEWASMAQEIAAALDVPLGEPLPRVLPERVAAAVAERDRLRRDCDAAAEACGVAVVSQVPEAWRLLCKARDEAVAERDTAREALAAVRDTLGVVGNGSPVLAAESLREERDTLRASVAELREDLAAAEAARAEAVQEAARLRVALGEAREVLAGKTQHDAAAAAGRREAHDAD